MITKCRFGDLNVQIEHIYERTAKNLESYLFDFNIPNLKLEFTEQDFEFEKKSAIESYGINYHNKTLEPNIVHRVLAEKLPLHNAFVLHSATFDVEGTGVAFAAHSGTGKTTHMLNWQKVLGDKMTVVNGDKPIVRFFDDEPKIPYAYGTPWNGKEKLGCNMRTQLKHICFIERSQTNFVEKVEKAEVINKIFNQVYMPKDPVTVMKTMELIDRLLSCCKLWKIHCNMDVSSAETAINVILNP